MSVNCPSFLKDQLPPNSIRENIYKMIRTIHTAKLVVLAYFLYIIMLKKVSVSPF